MLLISCLKILYHEAKATIKHNETNREKKLRKDQMRLDSDMDDDKSEHLSMLNLK